MTRADSHSVIDELISNQPKRSARTERLVFAIVFVAATILALCTDAQARPRHARKAFRTDKGFGLGLMMGAPTGLSAKYHLEAPLAIAGGVGFAGDHSYYGYWREGTHLHMDLLWHPTLLGSNRKVAVPLYLGVGARLLELERWYYDDGRRVYYGPSDTHLGVRFPFGIAIDFRRAPVDLFFEIALVADLYVEHRDDWDHPSTHLNAAIGARYYF